MEIKGNIGYGVIWNVGGTVPYLKRKIQSCDQ